MKTLLLRLSGPMQSWGLESRFGVRDSGREPSKSGVIGLLCAALGKPRAERPKDGYPTLAELAALRMGVRVNQEGTLALDYHTAGGGRSGDGAEEGVVTASGKKGRTVVSQRYYLADADFLVGLESEDVMLLERLDAALAAPTWALYLGRKAFVPGYSVRLPDGAPWGPGLRDGDLEGVLRGYPWQEERGPQRLVFEDRSGEALDTRPDVPLSFLPRRFALRWVRTEVLSSGVGP
jgi:CRISPR system Cascade subunit CasD